MTESQIMILWQVISILIIVWATIVFFIRIVKAILCLFDATDEPHNETESCMQSIFEENRYRTQAIDDFNRGFITEEKARRRIAASNKRSQNAEIEYKLIIRGSNGKC